MAEFETVRRTDAGVRTAQIDEGLRAHMNKVYGTMSVGMLMTALPRGPFPASRPRSCRPRTRSGRTPYLTAFGVAIYASPLKWLVMFSPLIFVFAFSAVLNRMSAATAQLAFYAFAVVMGLSLCSIFLVFTGLRSCRRSW